jgi:serine/threonine-protein kinase
VLSVAAAARRLGGDLPDFEPVWVDALAQARILTPLQAAEINAGRAEGLLWAPFQIARRLPGPGYVECYAAYEVETRHAVRLYVVRRPQMPAAELARPLAAWVDASRLVTGAQPGLVQQAGHSGGAVWAACDAVDGTVAADWLAENGRLPGTVVLEIARQMAAQLALLEHHHLVHGDLSAAAVVLQKSGRVVLPMPGLRSLVRPAEGYSFCDLQPEALDSLSPERVAEGLPPSVASDMYACGTLWWHLLAGRSPLAGGNSLLKLKAVHAAKLPDVRRLAPDVPEVLAHAIASLTAMPARERPASFAAVCEMLGASTRAGAAQLARCVVRPTQVWQAPKRNLRRTQPSAPLRVAPLATACALLLGLATLGVYAQRGARSNSGPRTEVAAASPTLQLPNHPASTGLLPGETQNPPSHPTTSPVRLASATELPATMGPEDLVLPSGKTVLRRGLALKAGQRVRAKPGQRATLSVPRGGLLVARDDTRFENIDFIWEHEADVPPGSHGAMVVLEAQNIEFRGCSFTAAGDSPVAAIALAGGASPAVASNELTMIDCVVRGTRAVVDCLAAPHLAVQLHNTLCVSSGPMLRMHRPPHADESITLTLDQVTARGESPALECRVANDAPAGPISICATACVFDLSAPTGLLAFAGARPAQVLSSLSWTGHASLVTGTTGMAVWTPRGKSAQALAEDAIEIAGLARCQVEFAGPVSGPPGASRITHWQGPLRSTEPPGARVHSLPTARVKRTETGHIEEKQR